MKSLKNEVIQILALKPTAENSLNGKRSPCILYLFHGNNKYIAD